MSERNLWEATKEGIPQSALDIKKAREQEHTRQIPINDGHGVEIPTKAVIAYSGEKPRFVGNVVEDSEKGIHFEFRTRDHRKRIETDHPITLTLLTLKLPPGCELLCEIEGKFPILFSTSSTNSLL